MENDQDEVPTASTAVWIGLVVTAIVSFWCQATVTEERFVPALNVIANAFDIPSDIAGATLMAAGASSPELFSSLVALFVTHSSLGLGTVFGSEVFNQLIICAGAVYASPNGKLQLNKAVVTREVLFYALGIVALYLALQDVEPVASDPSGIDHIFINFRDACMVFGGYLFYVLVCANMDAIVGCCCSSGDRESTRSSLSGSYSNYGSIEQGELEVGDDMPFLQQRRASSDEGLEDEPVGNFVSVEYYRTMEGSKNISIAGNDRQMPPSRSSSLESASVRRRNSSFLEQSIRGAMGRFSDGASLRPFQFLMSAEKPSDDHGLYDIEENEFEERLSCFLWQRSYFYNKARFAMHGWHLRWFSLMRDTMYSVPNRADFAKHKIRYPHFVQFVVDRPRHVIKLVNPHQGRRNFYVMAPSDEILTKVLDKLETMAQLYKYQQRQAETTAKAASASLEASDTTAQEPHDDNDFESMIEFPTGASNLAIVFFFVLFPFRALIHYTIPDVRTLDKEGNPKASLSTASLASLMCLIWLIIGSYAMVASLEALASLLDIPDAVIGYTVSAAGTSLPNYVASSVAARNGFGNMAVSNALGSNTFNIMVALGLPWVLYTSFGTHFQPYNELRNEGITQGVLILGGVLLLLVLLLLQSGFVLHQWHGHLFVLTYVAYLTYVIGQVYWW